MAHSIYQVDAFTDRPFAGNPAAVCLLDDRQPAEWMQSVAAEMNLSETAFLQPADNGFDLRWFTPAVEVDLCGHATLAAAHVLWESARVSANETICFSTRSGMLTAISTGEDIVLNFPAQAPEASQPPTGLMDGLGIDESATVFVGKNQADWLLELENDAAVRALSPDFRILKDVPARGIIVTAASADSQFNFISRFFAPASGIDEDPVTGSAHCCLGPYWSSKLNTNHLVGFQASQRGGVVGIEIADDRVNLKGRATTVLRGELIV